MRKKSMPRREGNGKMMENRTYNNGQGEELRLLKGKQLTQMVRFTVWFFVN